MTHRDSGTATMARRGAGRSRRRGFTLLEIMTALAVTTLVATLAASALRAGLDVRARVQTHRVTLDAEARTTGWLTSMLRHAPSATAVNEPLLSIVHAPVAASQVHDADVLTFMSQGVEPPLGSGQIWRVSLEVEEDGLHIRAVAATGGSNRIPLETVLPHVDGLLAEALDAQGGPGNSPVWRSDWPVLRTMPSAVRLTFALRGGGWRAPLVFVGSPLPVDAEHP